MSKHVAVLMGGLSNERPVSLSSGRECAKALRNAGLLGVKNAEFVCGGIESLPLADDSVDVVISNGVFNLCPDKPGVLAEAYRVLRPGGRLQMADILLEEGITPEQVARLGCWSD